MFKINCLNPISQVGLADLTDDFHTLPLRINDGTHDYRDGVDISVDEIYRRQPEEDFKTSQPVVEDILEMLKKIRADGFSKVICLILSEGLSGAI